MGQEIIGVFISVPGGRKSQQNLSELKPILSGLTPPGTETTNCFSLNYDPTGLHLPQKQKNADSLHKSTTGSTCISVFLYDIP